MKGSNPFVSSDKGRFFADDFCLHSFSVTEHTGPESRRSGSTPLVCGMIYSQGTLYPCSKSKEKLGSVSSCISNDTRHLLGTLREISLLIRMIKARKRQLSMIVERS